MAKIGYLYLRDGAWEGKQLLPSAWIDRVTHAKVDMRLGGLRYCNLCVPRVNTAKGTWQDNHTFVIDRLVLGLGQPPERWTLTFDGEKLNVRANIPDRPELSIDGKTGG
jgi:hypothetical protein